MSAGAGCPSPSSPGPSSAGPAPTRNAALLRWVEHVRALTQPEHVHWCDGSEAERTRLTEQAVAEGVLIPLNPAKRPGSYLHRSHPNDVARVEHLTFICTPTRAEAGPTNHWMAPADAYHKLGKLFEASMRGRTMYVIPYVMGPLGSPFAKVGVEITDSIYVVLNMRIMTRIGTPALELLGPTGEWNRGLHALLDVDPERRFICHFPQDNTIWSVGSGYGGNVLLGKKCLALRIGSYLGRREGWLAEHMLILGVESPDGELTYVAAAFPSACGKTNFAMLVPPRRFAGWRVFTVGDDIAWLRPGPDGRLWAVNPEAGYFGVAPGTSERSNPTAMATLSRETIFTNVALTPDGDVWWEGIDDAQEPPAGLLDWRGRPWQPGSGEPAAHPNARFTVPMRNNPQLSKAVEDPEGVPISAILFGGRRADTMPLALHSFNWTHGVYLGATMGSETTAAATGAVGTLRRDPMAMLPFCGYDIGSYFAHWLRMGGRLARPPQIFAVNWFRKAADGSYLWPGYGENMSVLQWIVARVRGQAGAQETPMGAVPLPADLHLEGLRIDPERVRAASAVQLEEWQSELESQRAFFEKVGETLPHALALQRELLLASLAAQR